jgi:catechol 2,3-dioxygenase-like lactoylglutathione lyase family enzyme
MKRLHINVGVSDLQASIRFYSTLFNDQPTVVKDDYAKWMLDDPLVNFAISSRGAKKGIDHLGIQVETRDELREIYRRMEAAGAPLIDQGPVTCCYAKSEKHWSHDPEGIAWETFLTTGESTVYGNEPEPDEAGACCDRPSADELLDRRACCAGEIRNEGRT